MADSNEKNEPQVETQKPPEVTAIAVRNVDGSVRQALKDKSGKFVRKERPLIPTIEFVRDRRKRLTKVRQNTGRFDGMTENRAIIEELLEFIHMPIAIDAKTGLPDAKHMMAKTQAVQTILLFTEGKPAPSEQELSKLEKQPFQLVYVPVPNIMNPEVVEYNAGDEKKQPSFAEDKKDIPIADAEVVQQN